MAASFAPDQALRVIDLSDGTIMVDEPGPVAEAAASFSNKSGRLAVGRRDGMIALYDVANKRLERALDTLRGQALHDLAFSPDDGLLAVTLSGATVHFLSVGPQHATAPSPLPVAPGARVAWSRDGRVLATAGKKDSRVVLTDLLRRESIDELEGHPTGGINLVFSPADDRLASVGWDVRLRIWHASTGRLELTIPALNSPPVFAQVGDTLKLGFLATGSRLKRAELISPTGYRSLERPSTRNRGDHYRFVSVSPDNCLLAAGTIDGVELWNLAPGDHQPLVNRLGETPWVQFRPTDKGELELFTTGASGLALWKVEPGDPPRMTRLGMAFPAGTGSSLEVANSKEGTVVAVAQGLKGGLVFQFNGDQPSLPDGTRLPRPDAESVDFIAVSPNGKLVATGCADRVNGDQVKIFQPNQKGWSFLAGLPGAPITRVGFSPDGRWLVSTGGGAWISAVGKWERRRLWATEVWGVAWSPKSSVLALETGGGVIRLVDPATGRELAALTDPNLARANHLAFSHDGRLLVASTTDRAAIRVWDLLTLCNELERLGLGRGAVSGDLLSKDLGIEADARR